ncbi:MAG TPA: lantibiotic dehydratase C-terminal domain-containing protein [Longimicrobiaceae bacterium]|jgi:hypothetical protein|nr:lantibiotic dehydratase C-terminal domain-containing protein [Longimicrobiaceae bacterium]
MHSPDPTVTANIYSARHLDEIVRGVVVPLRHGLAERGMADRWSLWTMRYLRRGPHLKLRLHGPEQEAGAVRELLEEAAEAHFASLSPEGDGPMKHSKAPAGAVDLEDEGEGERPDRTLLWTTYRRSAVSFGPDTQLLADDRYVSLFTACLAAAGEIAVTAIEPEISEAGRLKALRGGLAAGVSGLPLTETERDLYLEYHRDWLLRWMMPHAERDAEMLAKFDLRADASGAAAAEIRRIASEGPAVGAFARWRDALAELAAYVARFRGDPAHHVDPFTADPVFPALFKVFHSLANQLGVDMLNESMLHHIVLRALAGAAVAGA